MILATSLEASLPEITGRIIDNLFDNTTQNQIIFYAILVFLIIFFSSLFNFIATNASSWVSNKVVMDLRVEMFNKLLKLPKKYFDKTPTGKTISRLVYDVEQLSAMASNIWLDLIKAFLSVVILVGYLFWTSWQLSLVLLIILPIVYLVVKASSSKMKQASITVQQSMGDITHHINENVVGNILVKIYDIYNISYQRFNSLANIIRQKKFRVNNVAAINALIVNILIGLSLAFVVYFAATYAKMSAGEFMAFFTAMGMLIKPAKSLVNINRPIQQSLAAGESVFNFLAENTERENGKNIDIIGNIEFKNVIFAYDEKPVLNGVNFTIKQGESLALVGATGSGKSTITSLIAGFYPIANGQIFIDNFDINELSLKCLRGNIAIVEQKVNLLSDSIKNNISPNKDVAIDSLIASSKIANAYDFIDKLDNKFEQIIGNNGVELSGGQAQRLAIARAVIKNAKILILDEATSALDSKTEKLVQKSIEKLQQGKTTIIIAHRLSTIINADKIAVIDNGKVVEFGTHQELLELKNHYHKLYEHQFK
jgi:subfamily B ATP-binding cassette protein MsbA